MVAVKSSLFPLNNNFINDFIKPYSTERQNNVSLEECHRHHTRYGVIWLWHVMSCHMAPTLCQCSHWQMSTHGVSTLLINLDVAFNDRIIYLRHIIIFSYHNSATCVTISSQILSQTFTGLKLFIIGVTFDV